MSINDLTHNLIEQSLRKELLEHRRAIRIHRDARGDDRCWLDDYSVWDRLINPPKKLLQPIPRDEGMKQCELFFRYRRSDTADTRPAHAILDRDSWDDDIRSMSKDQLLDELVRIEEAILAHCNVYGRHRTIEDDRALYRVLPEKMPADFRLPPKDEFLGRAKSGAGCPNFWDSHSACGRSCNLHQWGPCTDQKHA